MCSLLRTPQTPETARALESRSMHPAAPRRPAVALATQLSTTHEEEALRACTYYLSFGQHPIAL